MSYNIAYMWKLKKKKKDTNEFIHKTETDSQTYRTNLTITRGEGRGTGWEFGMDM